MVIILVKEVFMVIFVRWDNKEIEAVKNFLLFKLPILIMEVVFNPHESLVYHLWHYRLLEVHSFML